MGLCRGDFRGTVRALVGRLEMDGSGLYYLCTFATPSLGGCGARKVFLPTFFLLLLSSSFFTFIGSSWERMLDHPMIGITHPPSHLFSDMF